MLGPRLTTSMIRDDVNEDMENLMDKPSKFLEEQPFKKAINLIVDSPYLVK
ncbi:4883_t:CDS:1, partial [Acaulospora colombiana]